MTEPQPSPQGGALTPSHARNLLGSMPQRPRRHLELKDHLAAAGVIALSMAAGLVALAGRPWWAILPAVAALAAAGGWLASRKARVNEPRLGRHTVVIVVFSVWLFLPIWRGITRGETIPFPEALIFAGLAPAAWLGFYLVLLLRR